MSQISRLPRHGFTLIEILVVVVILGILAAIVIPQFTSATAESRENSIKMSLHRMRIQIEVYRQHHNGDPPTLANFAAQMTQASNVAGDTAAPGTDGYFFGPYIREVPVNPNAGNADVTDTEPGTSGWYYDENTGELFANDSVEAREF